MCIMMMLLLLLFYLRLRDDGMEVVLPEDMEGYSMVSLLHSMNPEAIWLGHVDRKKAKFYNC